MTSSKDDAAEVEHQTVRDICRAVNIPAVAIGGITIDNVPILAGNGLSGIAVISAIFGADDIQNAAQVLKEVTKEMVEK